VGILSTPYAVKQGGWLGLVILAVLGALAWYTGILLRRCLDSKDGLETYPDIGHAAFGTAGRIIISVSTFHTSNAHLLFSFVFFILSSAMEGVFVLTLLLFYAFCNLQIILYMELYVST
jgi:amino acid permease